MGDYTLNTVKGHGFAVGDQVNFYGMGNSEFPPAEEPSLCVLTKQGNKYVLTYTATVKGDTITWEFGPAAKIWASKVETVAVSPVAQGQTVHNVETDEVFAVAEVTPRSVSLRRIGTWRDGVTVSMVDIVDMINMGTLVIIGNPDDKRAEVETTTNDEGHGFSGHSRRPMECRLCSRPAEVHATTTDEGSSRAMWTKARKEAGMSATDAPSANPWGPCGPCDGTDAPMARKAHPCGLMTSGSTTVAVFTEAVTAVISEGDTVGTEDFATWDSAVATVIARLHYFSRVLVKDAHVMLDVTAEQLATARRAGLITEYDEYLSVTSLAAGLLTEADRVNAYLHFNPRPTVPPINSGIAHVFVPKPEGFEGGPSFCIAPCHGHVSMPFHMPAESIGTPWRRAECVIWAGTGTLVKPAIRTGLNRRKRKATRRNRARVGGGF